MRRNAVRTLLVCLFAAQLAPGGSASAVDGVIEINNASVLAAGGYPAVIGAPGSYVLTSNLTPPAGANGIDVLAANVTIDLNGFEISGPALGVAGINGALSTLTVANGAVTGFTTGIAGGIGAKISQVRVDGNTTGISGASCLVIESEVYGNLTGISAQDCKIENNIIFLNTGPGISGVGNVIVHNRIDRNFGGGILTPGGSTIQENVITNNFVFGISDSIFGPPPPPPPGPLPQRVNIRGNTIHGNGGAGGGPGVSFVMPVLISENTVSGNTGSGVVCGSACTLNGNLIDSNNTALLPASGGASVGAGGNVSSNAISFNAVSGLTLSVLSGYSNNTLALNGPGGLGPNVIPVGGPIHPASGLANLCNGVLGPAPTCP